MYFEVASKLYIGTNATAYSQAISMEGANSVQVNFTAFSGTAVITVEEGNDLENWSATYGTITGTNTFSAATYNTFKCTPIAARYVRLKYAAGSTAPVIGVGINTSSL